jgi:hypothetical protein
MTANWPFGARSVPSDDVGSAMTIQTESSFGALCASRTVKPPAVIEVAGGRTIDTLRREGYGAQERESEGCQDREGPL